MNGQKVILWTMIIGSAVLWLFNNWAEDYTNETYLSFMLGVPFLLLIWLGGLIFMRRRALRKDEDKNGT